MVKVSCILYLFLLSCRGIAFDNGDIDGPATMPPDGSTYTVSFKASGSRDSTIERVRFAMLPDRIFVAQRISGDTVIAIDSFHLRDDQDLELANKNEAYPVGTRGSYVISSHAPAILRGMSYEATTLGEFRYEGTDRVEIGDTSYLCSRIKCRLSISPDNGAPNLNQEITYWYSSKLGYFTLIRSSSRTDAALNFERRITSLQ